MGKLARSVSHDWDNIIRSRSNKLDILVLRHSSVQRYPLIFASLSLKGPPQFHKFVAIGFCGVRNSLFVCSMIYNWSGYLSCRGNTILQQVGPTPESNSILKYILGPKKCQNFPNSNKILGEKNWVK